jgi:hypothetical protein
VARCAVRPKPRLVPPLPFPAQPVAQADAPPARRLASTLGLMKQPMLVLAAFLFLVVAQPCLSREVQVRVFRFDIPDSWYSEGGGPTEGKFFASGATAQTMFAPPNALVEACVSDHLHTCNETQLPNPTKEFALHGCGSAVPQYATLRGGIEETRWVCETVNTSSGPLTAGIAIYRSRGSFLYLAHFSPLYRREVTLFLNGVAQSIVSTPIPPTTP